MKMTRLVSNSDSPPISDAGNGVSCSQVHHQRPVSYNTCSVDTAIASTSSEPDKIASNPLVRYFISEEDEDDNEEDGCGPESHLVTSNGRVGEIVTDQKKMSVPLHGSVSLPSHPEQYINIFIR